MELPLSDLYPVNQIVLSGQVVSGRHLVQIDEVPIDLTSTELVALTDLVRARVGTEHGISSLPSLESKNNVIHTTIWRLRRALDRGLGLGAGDRLVRHVLRSRYLLAVERQAIVIDPSIAILVPAVLSERVLRDLLPSADLAMTEW